LSIDPGTRNLGVCILRRSDSRILGWSIIDLIKSCELRPKKKISGGTIPIQTQTLTHTQRPALGREQILIENMSKIFDYIFNLRQDLIPDIVVLEKQYRNVKMTKMSTAIATYFIVRFHSRIVFRSAIDKFIPHLDKIPLTLKSKLHGKGREQYENRKKVSVIVAIKILTSRGDNVWSNFIESFPVGHNDDLTDAFLQGLLLCDVRHGE